MTRTSVPPPSMSSIPRASVPPQYDDPIDVEVGLDSIPEIDEPPSVDGLSDTSDRPSRSFSVGGVLGQAVNRVVRLLLGLMVWVIRILTLSSLVLGRILGSIFDIIFMRPVAFFSNLKAGPFITLAKYLFLAGAIYTAWHQLHEPILQMLPARSPQYSYYAPDTPITNFDELSARLQNIEAALSGISLDQQRARAQQDLEARAHGDVVNRIFTLEARIRDEVKRVSEAEAHLKSSSSQGLVDLKREIQALQTHLSAVESAPKETATSVPAPPPTTDEVARAKLKVLEERLGGVEGGVKQALEQAKHAGQAPVNVPSGPAWWSKLAATVGTGAGLTIKSSDGSDVTSLMSQLVDTVARYGTQDFISRADFALHSAGARPIPHLTSGTLELRPSTLHGQILGLITGYGYEVGRSPITALHQDLHSGNCWPMTGSYGQLGVILALPAIISDITIDHVAKEVAFDLTTAPREMEVWGQVEGEDNLEKVAAWRAEQAMRRQAAQEAGEAISEADVEDVYPSMLPKDVPFIRLASFTYDIHAHSNIQTFPIRQEIRDLNVDFGIVALVIKNNWGKDGYTCLYRFRVHGERPGGAPSPFPSDNS
jgi:SUN domain-containing protein 1/2